MCTHPFAEEALTLHLARSEGHERYFGCNLMQRKVLASSHQHLMAEAPNGEKQIGRAYGAPRQPSTLPGARGVLLHPPVFVQLRDLHEHLRFVLKHIGCYLEVNALPSLGVLKAFVAE